MPKPKLYTALDVGTTKVAALIGAVGLTGRTEVLGLGVQTSHGLRKGTVVNVPEAEEAIRSAVAEAERQAGTRVREALVGVTGNHIASHNVTTRWQHSDSRHAIKSRDLEEILEASQSIPLEADRRLLHAIPRNYFLDGRAGARNPVGMHARYMDVETMLVTASDPPVQNLARAVGGAGIAMQGLVLEPLASAEAVMTADERQMGAVLIDIGGGTSDIAVFKDGGIWYSGIIPVGGHQLTNDLAVGLGTSYGAAEETKVRHGHLLPEAVREDEVLEVPRLGSPGPQGVARRRVAEILRERADELVQLALHHLRAAGLPHPPGAGVVLSGGSALCPGLKEVASRVLPGPVRIGAPRGLAGNVEAMEGPMFATSAGILLWNVRHQRASERAQGVSPRLIRRLLPNRLRKDRESRFVLQGTSGGTPAASAGAWDAGGWHGNNTRP